MKVSEFDGSDMLCELGVPTVEDFVPFGFNICNFHMHACFVLW